MNFERHEIYVRGKGDKERHVPVPPELNTAFQFAQDWQQEYSVSNSYVLFNPETGQRMGDIYRKS